MNFYTCSAACQQVHQHCRECGVLGGGEHLHRLEDGYCRDLLVMDDIGVVGIVPLLRSCWSTRGERTAAKPRHTRNLWIAA